MRLWIDCETRSTVPITYGVVRYAERVEVIMVQWAVDDGPVSVVDPTITPMIACPLRQLAVEADEIWAHNAEFDRTVLETTTWWPIIPLDKWRCTAALARMHGLPGGLEKLCECFKLPIDKAKDKRGYELIKLFCIPYAAGRYVEKSEHPEKWREFLSYGAQDIVAMRDIWRKIPQWNATPRMWAMWHLDQRMNCERGVQVDLALCHGAVTATTGAKAALRRRTAELTNGAVEATTQRDRLLAYMSEAGVDLPDLTADTVERRLEDESLPETIKELLRIRQQATKSSTAKYSRVLSHAKGNRLYNLLQFCGASRTGRWSGRTVQPQNFPRPKHTAQQIEQATIAFRTEAWDLLMEQSEVMELASSCLRGIIVSAPKHQLVVADLANIEGRVMAWLAGESWKLKAFQAYDAGTGPDLYKLAYARSFAVDPIAIGDDDPRRQIGKVQELALQYGGGVGAFCSMAETYGLDLDALVAAAWPTIPAPVKSQAKLRYQQAQTSHGTYGLTEVVWATCQALVILWRQAHPAVEQFWYGLENALKLAMLGRPSKVGRVTVDRVRNWIRIRLPSSRYLSYPAVQEDGGSVSFAGVSPYTRQWSRVSTYGGKLSENIVQAVSADILMDGMLGAERAGYRPVLSVHDEIISEPTLGSQCTHDGLSKIMCSSSPWAIGLPLAAKGFTSTRYAKR